MKKYPFILLLVFSALALTIIACAKRDTIYVDYKVDLLKNPMLSMVFEGIKDKNYPWNAAEKADETLAEKDEASGEDIADDITDEEDHFLTDNESGKTDHSLADNNEPGKTDQSFTDNEPERTDHSFADNEPGRTDHSFADNEPGKIDHSFADNEPEKTEKSFTDNKPERTDPVDQSHKVDNLSNNSIKDPEQKDTDKENSKPPKTTDVAEGKLSDGKAPKKNSEKAFHFTTVKESYFDDAVFIGDSRTVGLQDYSGWKNTTFYADVGLTIYDVFDKKIVKSGRRMITVEEALEKKQFHKIYIMLGINEMGTGNAKSFTKAYKGVVEHLEELQPDAIIIVQGIMNVTKEKSDKDPIFNNKNIKDRNKHLARLADDKKIFYIDVNEAITDSTGGIPQKYTFDSIHLKAAYYNIWTEFLLKHGVVK